MILRRVIEHVTDQSWVAVGIDFLIVVLSIQLVFQKRRADAPRLLRMVENPTGGDR